MHIYGYTYGYIYGCLWILWFDHDFALFNQDLLKPATLFSCHLSRSGSVPAGTSWYSGPRGDAESRACTPWYTRLSCTWWVPQSTSTTPNCILLSALGQLLEEDTNKRYYQTTRNTRKMSKHQHIAQGIQCSVWRSRRFISSMCLSSSWKTQLQPESPDCSSRCSSVQSHENIRRKYMKIFNCTAGWVW